MGYLHSVSIQNVTFYEPDSDLSAIIKRSSKKRRLTNLIISLAGTLIFTAVFYFSIHSLLVSGIVLLIFLPSLISAIVSFVKKPCGGVRFGTVLDYYTRTVRNDIKDTSQTYEYISIRLDDSGEMVQNLLIEHSEVSPLKGKQVVLYQEQLRKKKKYYIYSSDNLMNVPVWHEEPAPVQPAAPDRFAPSKEEILISDVRFSQIPDDLYPRICRKMYMRTFILIAILCGFTLIPAIASILFFVCQLLFSDPRVPFIVSAVTVAGLIAAMILVFRIVPARRAHYQIVGAMIHIDKANIQTQNKFFSFTEVSTGKRVVNQRIDYNECGLHPDGMNAILVREPNGEYAVYPADRPF